MGEFLWNLIWRWIADSFRNLPAIPSFIYIYVHIDISFLYTRKDERCLTIVDTIRKKYIYCLDPFLYNIFLRKEYFVLCKKKKLCKLSSSLFIYFYHFFLKLLLLFTTYTVDCVNWCTCLMENIVILTEISLIIKCNNFL